MVPASRGKLSSPCKDTVASSNSFPQEHCFTREGSGKISCRPSEANVSITSWLLIPSFASLSNFYFCSIGIESHERSWQFCWVCTIYRPRCPFPAVFLATSFIVCLAALWVGVKAKYQASIHARTHPHTPPKMVHRFFFRALFLCAVFTIFLSVGFLLAFSIAASVTEELHSRFWNVTARSRAPKRYVPESGT